MKKILPWLIFICLYLQVAGQPQLHQGTSFIFNGLNQVPQGDHIFEAVEYIEFQNGSEYNPEQNISLEARIDPYLILDVEYLQSPVTCQRELNLDREVGATSAKFHVNDYGAAVYDIPLVLPPGTNSMVPQLSFTYNSSKENFSGYMGKGWCTQGLSAISRTTKTIIQDGVVEGIKMDYTDRFDLDGNRLTAISGQYGEDGCIYHTEMESFVQVTSVGSFGQGPDSFIVETKDGKKLYYGGTENSKYILPELNGVYQWLLSRIEDQQGNYIEFNYLHHLNDVLINEISYTGNSKTNLLPYNKVRFYYGKRNDITTICVVGKEVTKDLLLTGAKITSESNVTHRYKFDYVENDNQVSFYSSINQITEYGLNDKCYNSTVFTSNNTGTFPFTIEDKPYTIPGRYSPPTCYDHGGPYPNSPDPTGARTQLYVGDFNGDGWDDYLTLNNPTNINIENSCQGEENAKITVQLSIPGTNARPVIYEQAFIPINAHVEGRNIRSLKIVDINGDGLDDIIFQLNNFDNYWPGLCTYHPILLLNMGFEHPQGPWFMKIDLSNYMNLGDIPFTNDIGLFTGDFLGDGRHEILIVNEVTSTQQSWILVDYPNNTFTFTTNEIDEFGRATFIGDFNGDSKDEFLLQNDDNIAFYDPYALPHIPLSPIFQMSTLDYWIVEVGDFNGDNQSDLLCNIAGQGKSILHFNGSTFIAHEVTLAQTQGSSFLKRNANNIDLNGDNKTDLVEMIYSSNWVQINTYYSLGNFEFYKFEDTFFEGASENDQFFHLGDFNGDGAVEISYNKYEIIAPPSNPRYEVASPVKIFNLHRKDRNAVISCIKDGLNNAIEIENAPLCEKHLEGEEEISLLTNHDLDSDYPNSNYNSTRNVVKSVRYPTGLSSFVTRQYKYEDAIINRLGRGFLGFTKTIQENSTGEIITRENELLNKISVFAEKSTTVAKPIETMLNRKTLTNELNCDIPGIFILYPSSVIEENFITNNTYSTTYEYTTPEDLMNGNISKIVKSVNGTDGTETINYKYVEVGGWCPSKISEVNTSTKRMGEEPIERHFSYSYFQEGDNLGLISSIIQSPGLPKQLTTSFPEYDAYGNVLKIDVSATDVEAREETMEFDSKGRFITKHTNALDQVTLTNYDGRFGGVLQNTDINNLKTRFSYDEFGRLKNTAFPQGTLQTIILGWDNNGSHQNALYHQTITSSGLAPVTVYYDFLGRQVEKRHMGFKDEIIEETHYNDYGLIDKSSEPHYISSSAPINWIDYSYEDPLFRCTKITSPSIDQSFSYSSSSVIFTDNFTQQTVNKSYNQFGELRQVIEQNGANIIDYSYNSHGQIRKINVSGTETTFGYDPDYGYQTSLSDPSSGVTQYEYNSLGLMLSQTDNKGITTSLNYDLLGRVVSVSNPVDGSIDYLYDGENAIGKLSEIEGYNGINIAFAYDQYGRVIKKAEEIDGSTYNTCYQYDANSFIKKVTYPSISGPGFALLYSYHNGYLNDIKNANTKSLIYQNEQFNALEQVEQYNYGNGIRTIKTYDPDDHIIESIESGGVGSDNPVFHYIYEHDMHSKLITSRRDVTRNLIESFGYDPTYLRLTNVIGSLGTPSSTISYDESDNGNILRYPFGHEHLFKLAADGYFCPGRSVCN